MSKSYNNTIPLFIPEKQLRKLIMKIKTNSLEPGEPKDTNGCTLFEIFQAFATESEVSDIKKRYAEGISWGEMKQHLYEYLNDHLSPFRKKFEELMTSPDHIEAVLQKGRTKAREKSIPFLQSIRQAVGISHIE
jgi:tryptophanyl-tRNA synthetase